MVKHILKYQNQARHVKAFAAFVLALCSPALADAPADTRDYYRATLQHMVNQPEPAKLHYRVTVFATGQSFYVSRDPDTGLAEFGFAIGDALGVNSASWPARVQLADATTFITLDGSDAATAYPIFDASWNGAYRWLKYGFGGSPPATPLPSATPSDAPNNAPSPDATPLGIIAVVNSINTGAYRVQDYGAQGCAGGDPGRAIHLIAVRDADTHPATDLTIDTANGDICTMRFQLRRTQFFALTGSVELHYARVGGYLLASWGRMSLNSDIHGIGWRRVDVSFVYSDIAAIPK